MGKFSKEKSKINVACCWKKKSIFFFLEYWRYLHIFHNLEVMHIEKNVCEISIGTLLNIQGKTKDGLNTRLDLMKMGLRSELAPRFEKKKLSLSSLSLLHTLYNREEDVLSNISKLESP